MELVKKERPKSLESITVEVNTGCGHLYVTIGHDSEGTPIEIIATLGKAGGCSYCLGEALSRAISLGLRYGIPVGDYVKQLAGLQCPSPNMWPREERVLSCADGIAKVLNEYKKEWVDGYHKG